MALMEAKVSHGNGQTLRHGKGGIERGGRTGLERFSEKGRLLLSGVTGKGRLVRLL